MIEYVAEKEEDKVGEMVLLPQCSSGSFICQAKKEDSISTVGISFVCRWLVSTSIAYIYLSYYLSGGSGSF